MLPLSNGIKRTKDHESFLLAVLVVPLFCAFCWRFSTKKKPTFGVRTLAIHLHSKKNGWRMGKTSKKLVLFYSCLESWISVSHIFLYPQTSNLKPIFVWNVWNLSVERNQGCFKIGRIFESILHMIPPSMTSGLRFSWAPYVGSWPMLREMIASWRSVRASECRSSFQ